MQAHEAEGHLREILRLSQADDVALDAVKIWEAFQDFCRLPVSGPTVLLFTCEQDDRSAPSCSCFSFERQMSVSRASAYSHTEHLTCTLSCPLMSGTRPLEDEEIVFEVGSDGTLEDFIAEVEAANQFKAFMEQSQAMTLTIMQGKL